MSYVHAHFIKTKSIKGAVDYKHSKEYKKLYKGNTSHEANLKLAAAKRLRAKQDEKK